MDEHEEVNMIDTLISQTFEESCYEDPLEKFSTHFGHNFDIDESLEEVNALLDFIMNTDPWKPKVENPYLCQHLFLFHQSRSSQVRAQAFARHVKICLSR